jgi:hypothetical protein
VAESPGAATIAKGIIAAGMRAVEADGTAVMRVTRGVDARFTTARLLPVITIATGAAALLLWLFLVARAFWSLSVVGVM